MIAFALSLVNPSAFFFLIFLKLSVPPAKITSGRVNAFSLTLQYPPHTTFFKSQRPLTLHYNGSATSNMLRRKKSRLPKRGETDNLPWGFPIVISFRETGNTTVSMTREEKISSPPSCLLLNSILIVQLVPTVHKTLRFSMAAVLENSPACLWCAVLLLWAMLQN